MWAKILGLLFSELVGRILEWFKKMELEAQNDLAQELKQHAESVQAANASQEVAAAAVAAHQAAVAQVTDLQAQLDEIKRWNQKSAYLKLRAKEIRRPK